jgi:hypothetical protein
MGNPFVNGLGLPHSPFSKKNLENIGYNVFIPLENN